MSWLPHEWCQMLFNTGKSTYIPWTNLYYVTKGIRMTRQICSNVQLACAIGAWLHNCCLQLNLPLLSLMGKAQTSRGPSAFRPVNKTWRHHRTTGLHWPSERPTQHNQVLLPVHFLLSSGCDDSTLLSQIQELHSSHWVIGYDTPICLWEKERERENQYRWRQNDCQSTWAVYRALLYLHS